MPAIRFDPALVEAVVTAEVDRSERTGDGRLAEAYHRLADPIYARVPPDEREAAFEQLHAHFFERLGYPGLVAGLFAEMPALEPRAPARLVLPARLKHEEGAVLGRDEQSVCLRVLAARFADGERLAAFIRHELLHAADMLDSSFGYRVVQTASLGAANRLAERYRALWCAHVDARLLRRGVDPLADREAHRRDFDRCFASVPPSDRAALFERLWQAEQLTHTGIVALADEAHLLAQGAERCAPLPGGLCPLCRFPTYRWALEIAPLVVALIQADFPAWQADDAACERCTEGYSLRVQVSAQ